MTLVDVSGWSVLNSINEHKNSAEACVGRVRESMEASVPAEELGECPGEVREVANVSITALRTGRHC